MKNPLADPEPLIRRVYSYVAYRIGDGPDAEDVTSDVFERALRYRETFDPKRGTPIGWLIGIARRAIDDAAARRPPVPTDLIEETDGQQDLEAETAERLTLAEAISRLSARDRELVALRYGADLTARQIAELIGTTTNAVEVALHRALARLRADLDATPSGADAALAPRLAEAM